MVLVLKDTMVYQYLLPIVQDSTCHHKHGKFINKMTADGIPVGTQANEMYGISKPGHTGNAPMVAHMNPITGMVDEGYWQGAFDGSQYSDPAKLADAFASESALPQIRMAELAQNQPGELEIQGAMAEAAGVDVWICLELIATPKVRPLLIKSKLI